MANLPLLSISGRITQLPAATVLEVQESAGIDTDAAGSLLLGASTATSIDIGDVGILTTVKGDFQVDGAETIVGLSTFENDASFEGDVTLGDAAADTLTINAASDFAAGDITATGNPSWDFGSGQADFDGNVDANLGLDVSGATLSASDGVLVTGGNLQLNDDQQLLFGSSGGGEALMVYNSVNTSLDIVVPTNNTSAFVLSALTSGENYLELVTTTGSEEILLGDGSGTNIAITQQGTGQVTFPGNVDASLGLDVSGGDLTAAGAFDFAITSTGTHSFSGADMSIDEDVDFGAGASAITAAGNPTWDFGTGQADFGGNVDANAGLDVTGATNMIGSLTQSGGGAILAGDELMMSPDTIAAILSPASGNGYTWDTSVGMPTLTQTGSGLNTLTGALGVYNEVDIYDGYSLQLNDVAGAAVDLDHQGDALMLNTNTAKAPRVTNTTKGNIGTPADGMIIYDTGTSEMLGYINGSWTDIGSAVTSVDRIVASINTSALAQAGQAGYYSANKTFTSCDNTDADGSKFGGTCYGAPAAGGQAVLAGVAAMDFDPLGLGVGPAAAGDLVYLDGGASAGGVTTTPPSAAGSYVAEVGVAMTTAADGSGLYDVFMAPKATVEIS